MITHFIVTVFFVAWALGLWAMLPKAFTLHVRRYRKDSLRLSAPVQLLWRPSAFLTFLVLVLTLLKFNLGPA